MLRLSVPYWAQDEKSTLPQAGGLPDPFTKMVEMLRISLTYVSVPHLEACELRGRGFREEGLGVSVQDYKLALKLKA